LTDLTNLDKFLCMSGSVRQNRDKFLIDISWRGERYRLCSDREGVPLDVIQDWFGHKSAASTRRYAKIQLGAMTVMHRQEKVVEIKRKVK
jgi:integrase